MIILRTALAVAAFSVASMGHVSATPDVVASIKPIHSLVAAVMQGVATPDLIVEGAASPHTYSLRPSQARSLSDADILFWVSHELEAFLEKPIETLGANARSVELIDAEGLVLLGFREGATFKRHGHGDDDHDEHEHEEHGHSGDKHDHDDDDLKDHADDDHGDEHGHEEHAHGSADPHVWLDPENARHMLYEIANVLSDVDPANAARYEANAEAAMARLAALGEEIEGVVAPVRERPFDVFHDAYHYFEARFGLHAAGSVTVSPETVPGAARVRDIQARIRELGATCLFAEPQFTPKLIRVVTEGTEARTGILDPLGASLEPGPDLYGALLTDMASSFRTCLEPRS
jgi:zinc transport system substrate-binding protein